MDSHTVEIRAYSPRFDHALAVAAQLHAGQFRKGTDRPYIGHLLGVCAIVFDADGSEDEAIAALLHDAVEDCGGPPTLEMIRRDFGETVAGIVEHCSDAMPLPGVRKAPFRERKSAYHDRLRRADAATLLVSAADKLHNLRSIWNDYQVSQDEIFGRFAGEFHELSVKREVTLWNFERLIEIYEAAVPADARLSVIVMELRDVLRKLSGATVAP